MPRKRTKPVAEHVESTKRVEAARQPDEVDRIVAAAVRLTPEQLRGEAAIPAAPFVPGDANEPDTVSITDLDFPADGFVRRTAKPEPGPVLGISRDDRQGVMVAVERERKPGQTGPRVMVMFRGDVPPNDAEKAVLRAEGFAYFAQEKSWCAPKTATNIVLAKRAVNKITHELRGDSGAALFI